MPKYRLLIDNSSDINDDFYLDEFPELEIFYLEGRNNLCPSQYGSKIRCFWEGDLQATLEVNGIMIYLNDHDERNGRVSEITNKMGNIYRFQGIEPLIEDGSTFLVFSIVKDTSGNKIAKKSRHPRKDEKREEKMRTYDIGQPFTLEFGDNPTTGYQWDFSTSPGLKIIDSTYSTHCQPEKTGCGGTRTLVLVGTKRGVQVLTGFYARSWDEPGTPEIIRLKII